MHILKSNQKRCNPFAPYTDEQGTRFNQMPAHLYEEIADPVPPTDYSDETYYRTEQDDAPYVIYTPKAAEQVRSVLKARAKALRVQKETEGFPYMGKTFDCDERSAIKINTAVQTALVAGVAFTIAWTAQDDTDVTMDQAAMLGMPAALAMYANSLHVAYRAHKAAIDAADFGALLTYDITTGWPE